MSKKCTICGKGSMMVWRRIKLRGRYNPTIKRRQYPNLQWMKLPSLGLKPREGKTLLRGKRILACTKCIKAQGKRK